DHTVSTPWSIDDIKALPKVDVVYAYGALGSSLVRAIAADARGLVFAGTGNGNIAEHMVGPLREATRGGMHVVRASRTGSGIVVRNGAQPDDDYD
ncbi:L-asparaginase, partial [Burkholderia sp. Bp8990]